MFNAALMPQAGLLFCLSLSNLSASFAPGGSVPISGRGALEAACLMPPRPASSPICQGNWRIVRKKVFFVRKTDKVGQSPNTNQTRPATESSADMPPAVSRFPALLQLSSMSLPQTKILPEFWGKYVQIYRTTTRSVFQQTLIGRPCIACLYVVVWVAKWRCFLVVGRVFASISIATNGVSDKPYSIVVLIVMLLSEWVVIDEIQ